MIIHLILFSLISCFAHEHDEGGIFTIRFASIQHLCRSGTEFASLAACLEFQYGGEKLKHLLILGHQFQ